MLRYNPSDGRVRVNFLHPEDGSNTRQFDTNLGLGWNNIVPFYSESNNQPHLVMYNFASGKLTFRRVHPDSAGTDLLKTISIYKGWTHMASAYFNRTPYLVTYDSRYGHFNVDRVSKTNDSLTSVLKTNIGKGYTHIIPYEEGPSRYLLLYKGGSGQMRIVKLTRQGQGQSETMSVSTTFTDGRRAGWSHLAYLPRNGRRYVFGYDDTSGKAKIWQIKSRGTNLEGVKNLSWTAGYTAITPYSVGSKGHLLVHDMTDGRTRKVRLKENISGFQTVMSGNWELGFK